MKNRKRDQKLEKMIQEGFLQFLNKHEIYFWKKFGELVIYPASSDVFYRDHVPIGAYVLVEGSVCIHCISARSVMKIFIEKPVMIGLNHILEFSEYRYSVSVVNQSDFIFLPKYVFTKELITECNKPSIHAEQKKGAVQQDIKTITRRETSTKCYSDQD